MTNTAGGYVDTLLAGISYQLYNLLDSLLVSAVFIILSFYFLTVSNSGYIFFNLEKIINYPKNKYGYLKSKVC